jgi:hypothetical protein
MTRNALASRLVAAATAVALAGGAAGCSFAFTSGPPSNHAQLPPGYFDCSTSNIVPVLDTLFTVIQVIRVGAAMSATDEEYEANDAPFSRQTDISLGVALGLLGAAGAYTGYKRVSECKSAKAAAFQRAGGMPYGAPPPAAPPPPPAAPGAPY